MRGLPGKRVFVTGGASGIGRAIALRLGAEGCAVTVLDIDGPGAVAVAKQIQCSSRALACTADVSNIEAVVRAVDASEAELGPIDVLVNNAGWDRPTRFVESSPEFWRKVIDINLLGPLNVTHTVARRMVARGGGKIINIASDAGRVGSSGEVVYSACKGGVIAFSKSLARELSRDNVLVNTICPGPTDTPLLDAFAAESTGGAKILEGLKRAIPLRRLGVPEDYPGLVAFFASEDANFIQGQTISVSGGLSMHG